MDPLVNPQSALTIPTSEDWSRLRPLIKELYHDRRFSMAEVRDHLKSLGYWVNTRMIRARISQWNLQRNNQFHGMVAALRLLDPDPASWPVPEPWFVIRGRHVPLHEILRYFRRKGIQNPIHWCRSAAVSQEEPAVRLLQQGDSPVEGSIDMPAPVFSGNGFVFTDTLPSHPILGVPHLIATWATAVHGYLESSGRIGSILR
uniref:Clr5 domain-containing protein n=1 Tax=Fusarium oxysporum (strain Fo5176) TaxID=660025 RepID=A0A0D2XKE9_FUSOF